MNERGMMMKVLDLRKVEQEFGISRVVQIRSLGSTGRRSYTVGG